MKTLFLALNEFNEGLLKDAAHQLKLDNLNHILSFHRSETWTEDTYESDYLEPWVQWVSLQTGVPSSKHQIKHLGDVPHLDIPQFWEKLSAQNITSGIWGAMNGSKGSAKLCKFFLPDPWTASEMAFPTQLNKLLLPLRYFSKNYLHKTLPKTLKELKTLLSFISSHKLKAKALKELPKLTYCLTKFPGKHFPLISFFDYLSTLLFLEYDKRYSPDFTFLFVNSLAHLQHHHWTGFDYRKNLPLKYGLHYIDKILGLLLNHIAHDTHFFMTNALSQRNTNQDKPWILYRQIDQADFLKKIGVCFEKVEPHMTHDAHIFFKTKEDRDNAKTLLMSITVEDNPLFLVESYDQELKLFYRVLFTDEVSTSARLQVPGTKEFRFFDLFKPIVKRTGKHIPYGTIFSNRSLFPSKLNNHDVFSYLYQKKKDYAAK